MEKLSGIVGITRAFRDALSDLKEGSKVVFVGSPFVCTPFIELLAYAVRDRNFEMVFIPKSDESEARKIREYKNIGYSVSEEKADPNEPDAIVLMGGLAMPKFGCSAEEISSMLKRICKSKTPPILGVCFMKVFRKQGWDKLFNFKKLIDATIDVEVY